MAHRLSAIRASAMRKAVQQQICKTNPSFHQHVRLACFYPSSTYASSLHNNQQQQESDHHHRSQPIVICHHHLSLSKDHLGSCGKCNLLGPVSQKQLLNTLPSHLHYTSMGFSNTDTNWFILRSLHTSIRHRKEESLAEKSLGAIKDKAKKADKAAEDEVTSSTETLNELKAKETVILKTTVEATAKASPPPPAPPVPVDTEDVEVVKKKSIAQRIVAEVKHYYHGFRLLFMDVRLCARYVRYVLNGRSLTRRERRQFVRTSADLFRLVPFLVFIVVPFMEFLLPVALKLFPNMLPSTFTVASKEQENIRNKLKVKLEMAKFLQDTIEETALTKKGKGKGESAIKFSAFLEKIRTTGTQTNVKEIKQYSKLFEDEITLDTLSHQQLMALCRLLEIPMPNLGTSNFLRFQLRQKLRQLKNDDKMIQKEGMESLALWELQEACRSRGMRSLGVSVERLKSQLDQWIKLHLEENIPTSLLLLSRALYLPEHLSTEEQLKQIIVELPTTATEEAKVKISEVTGERVDNKTKLDVLKQEEEAIRAEREAQRQAKKIEIAAEEKAKPKDMDAIIQAASTSGEASIVDSAPELKAKPEEVMVDKAPEMKDVKEAAAASAGPQTKPAPDVEEVVISSQDLEQVEDIIEQAAEEKKIALEKKSFKALREDVGVYKEAVSELKAVVLASGEDDLHESKAARRLTSVVDKMMNQMEGAMEKLYEEKQQLIEDIEVKEVRMKRNLELVENETKREKVLQEIEETKDELISINDLMLSMRKIQKAPDNAKLQRILQVLDEDQDGSIDINDALKVIELLGKDNMKLTSMQMSNIMQAIKSEDQFTKSEKEQKIKEKTQAAQEELKDPAVDMNTTDDVVLKDSHEKTISAESDKTPSKESSASATTPSPPPSSDSSKSSEASNMKQ